MRDLLVYSLFRLFSLIARLAGRRGAVALGYLIGLGIAATDDRASRILRHMARAVGRERARALLKRYYEHLGLVAVEYMRLDAYTPETVREWMAPAGLDRFREALSRGKGVLLLTGHIGNWELLGQALVAYDIPLRRSTGRSRTHTSTATSAGCASVTAWTSTGRRPARASFCGR